MNIESISDSSRWNNFIASSGNGHLLQCYEWGQLKAKFGWEVERIILNDQDEAVGGAQVFFRRTPIGLMAYVPRGPVVNDESPEILGRLMEGIHDLARDRKAIFLRVEPNYTSLPQLTFLGFVPSAKSVQPRTTIHVDLVPDIDTIGSRQKPKTRYNVRLAGRKGVIVREEGMDQLHAFYDLLTLTGKRDGFVIHSYDYYKEALTTLGDKVRLFCAYFEEELLAGIVVTSFAGEAIYMYGASSNSRRNLMPTYLLQWEAMKWAKNAGCTSYDLWGIPDEIWEMAQEEGLDDEQDERYQDGRGEGLWGVYRFKKGFGGTTVRYVGAHDYVYATMRYWAWQRTAPVYSKLLSRAVA